MLKTTLLPKNIRYYISNNGGKMMKIYREDNSEEGINIGYKCTLANIIDSENIKDYNINYQFYIDECNKLISSIENPIKEVKKKLNKKEVKKFNQLSLF